MSDKGFPRDPEKLELTAHAMEQVRDRNIGVVEIRNCISKGIINPDEGDGPDEARYRLEIPGVDLLLVISRKDMVIETAYWDDEQGAQGGALGGKRFDLLGGLL